MFGIIEYINRHPIFAGFITLLVNIGSKYIHTPLTDKQERLLTSEFARQFLIFCMFFQSTKDIITAIIMTASLHVLANHLLHEESKFCMIPNSLRELDEELDTNKDSKVSKTEILKAIKILQKNRKKAQKS